MTQFVKRTYDLTTDTNSHYILGADIGGTNSNFGIFQVRGTTPHLMVSYHTKSRDIVDFTAVVVDLFALVQQEYGVTITKACFAAAGVTRERRTWCKPTNVSFIIDAKAIIQQTKLTCAFIANDFEVIGHALDTLPKESLAVIQKGDPVRHANKAIIGAGTGLGKSILVWNRATTSYMPVCSEGGHADFAAACEKELALSQFIQKTESWGCNISWEDVISGNGIQRMYRFFQQAGGSKTNSNGLHPDQIFNNRYLDQHAWNTYVWYAHFYGRCVKNFALESLSQAGVYIAGGIAAHNVELFSQKEFLEEFLNCGKQRHLLEQMPLYVIKDYNVSLYGAAWYLLLEDLCIIV